MPARGSQGGAADEALQITDFLSHAFVRLRALRLHASIAARAIKGSGEDGGAAGAEPAAFFQNRGQSPIFCQSFSDSSLHPGAGR